MPYISTEALVGAALLVIVALGYQYIPISTIDGSSSTGAKSSKKKNKKKSKGSGANDATATNGAPDRIETSASTTESAVKQNGDAKSSKESTRGLNGPKEEPAKVTKPKTLAQKIAPQPRKTKVDDMLAPEDLPGQHARVMRVAPSSTPASSSTNKPTPPAQSPPALAPPLPTSEQKVDKYSDDYASSSDEDEPISRQQEKEDDGWGVVQTKKKKPVSISFSGGQDNTSTSLPLPTATKIQRKNQKKAESKKAAKAAEEEERVKRLAMHKRQQERAKIDELYSGKKKSTNGVGRPMAPVGGGGAAKATLDHNGKLIWD